MGIKRFEDIEAWQMAHELTKRVYGATKTGSFAKDFSGTQAKILKSRQHPLFSSWWHIQASRNGKEFEQKSRRPRRGMDMLRKISFWVILIDYLGFECFNPRYA